MREVLQAPEEAQTRKQTCTRYIKRFRRAPRYLHAVLFTTFLGLAATGLPLRFGESIWARGLASFVGGFGAILFVHKFCAIVLTGAFLVHVKDFFTRAFVHHEKGIFWGRTSMVANWKDAKDLVAHMRYFVGLGPKPQFDRYAYLEKFDYWAVFWGMLVIGFSGYAMWFAPFFAHFLPGWALNAVLVIGVESQNEFQHKRPLEFARVLHDGKLEGRLGEKPQIWQPNFSRVIGFTAIAIGLILLVLTLTAYFG